MAIAPTRFSRVSFGFVDSVNSIVAKDAADTGPAVSFTGGVVFDNGTQLNAISSATVSINFPSIAPLESSSVVTAGVSNLSRGDTLILTPDALWPVVAAHRDLSVFCSSSSTVGEVHVWAVNSTLTAVDAAASVFRVTRIAHPTYL